MNWLYWVSAGSLVFSISLFLIKRYLDHKDARELEEWKELEELEEFHRRRHLEVEEMERELERHRRLEDLNKDYEEAMKTEELMQELEREDNEKRSYTYSYRGSR